MIQYVEILGQVNEYCRGVAAMFTESDSVQLLGFGLWRSLTLASGLT